MKKTFVNSLPKSGTNLLAKCLLLFGYIERGHISAGTVLDKTPAGLYRRFFWKTNHDGYCLGVNSPIEVRKSPINNKLDKLNDNEFISAHVGIRDDLLNAIIKRNIVPIQVIRDPRAILASFVPYVTADKKHFLNTLFTSSTENERYNIAYTGISNNNYELKSLRDSCLALTPWLDNESVYTIKFEDIVGNEGGGSTDKRLEILHTLAKLLELPQNKITYVSDNLYGPGRHTFRKGKIDSWKDEIPIELLTHINHDMNDIMNKWGYSL